MLKYIKNIDYQEIIELDITNSSRLEYIITKKLIFNLDLKKFQTYFEFPEVFDVNKIVVAVIINKDFNKTISMNEFIEYFESNEKLPKHLQLPYDSILFQQPTMINAQEPRIPAVSLCIHNTWTIYQILKLLTGSNFSCHLESQKLDFMMRLKFQKFQEFQTLV